MNDEIRSIIKEHNLRPISYRKLKKAYVIEALSQTGRSIAGEVDAMIEAAVYRLSE